MVDIYESESNVGDTDGKHYFLNNLLFRNNK